MTHDIVEVWMKSIDPQQHRAAKKRVHEGGTHGGGSDLSFTILVYVAKSLD